MIFFWIFLFFKHTVLDLFDSIFLRSNLPLNKWIFLKRLIYAPANKIIVTDEARKGLMPQFLQHKLIVLPNYPEIYTGPISKDKNSNNDTLTLLFFGWLGMQRGGYIAQGLLEADERVRLIMLGWFSDDACRNLAKHPRADYRGVVSQEVALEIAATEADYILCLYEPVNINTIFASPNKIYDGIQTNTPVLINQEVKVSSLVEVLNIGLVLPSYFPNDFSKLADKLFNYRNSFSFSNHLSLRYSWGKVSSKLIKCHNG